MEVRSWRIWFVFLETTSLTRRWSISAILHVIWNIPDMCSCLPCCGCGTVCLCQLVSSESSPDSSNSAPLISGDKIFHEWSSKLKVGPKEVFICDYYLFFFVSKHQQNSAHTFDKFVMCNFKITRLLICRLKCEIWMFQDFPDEIWNGSIYQQQQATAKYWTIYSQMQVGLIF